MKKKQLLAALLSISMAFSLAGCSFSFGNIPDFDSHKDEESKSSDEDESSEKSKDDKEDLTVSDLTEKAIDTINDSEIMSSHYEANMRLKIDVAGESMGMNYKMDTDIAIDNDSNGKMEGSISNSGYGFDEGNMNFIAYVESDTDGCTTYTSGDNGNNWVVTNSDSNTIQKDCGAVKMLEAIDPDAEIKETEDGYVIEADLPSDAVIDATSLTSDTESTVDFSSAAETKVPATFTFNEDYELSEFNIDMSDMLKSIVEGSYNSEDIKTLEDAGQSIELETEMNIKLADIKYDEYDANDIKVPADVKKSAVSTDDTDLYQSIEGTEEHSSSDKEYSSSDKEYSSSDKEYSNSDKDTDKDSASALKELLKFSFNGHDISLPASLSDFKGYEVDPSDEQTLAAGNSTVISIENDDNYIVVTARNTTDSTKDIKDCDITSVDISEYGNEGSEFTIKGLRFGDSIDNVKQVFGEPSEDYNGTDGYYSMTYNDDDEISNIEFYFSNDKLIEVSMTYWPD